MTPQELNLLYLLDALITEGSVTRASERLGMSQPAVSNAIAKMRTLWCDPIFTRRGRQIEATAFALNLWNQIHEPVQQLTQALDEQPFKPATSRRSFRIALTDLSVDQIWLPLMQTLSRQAPNIDLHAMPFTQAGAVDQLRQASIDLAIGPRGEPDRSLRHSLLYTSRLVLVMRQDHPLAGRPLHLDDFLAARHLLVSRSGDAQGHVDAALQKQGLRRRVALTVNHFSAVPKLLRHSDLIAVLPMQMLSQQELAAGLWKCPPPLPLEPVPIYLLWHARLNQDAGLRWIRGLIEQLMRESLERTPAS